MSSSPNILLWNTRGWHLHAKVDECRSLINDHHLDIVCLVETTPLDQQLLPFQIHSGETHNFNISIGGRILIKWNASLFSLQTIQASPQFIHCLLSGQSTPPFYLTVVYAFHDSSSKASLWADLAKLNPTNNHPWLMVGDLNRGPQRGLTPWRNEVETLHRGAISNSFMTS
ncbi:hypothetical protein AXF42_Ash001766 [Apostasia shenzhenica]|uniref:Endonuclease/exonuclease/phosphatase domain-containing protein n=1 Tax=Apostasia shenzhenica TaxID=1088818 RepID=A0A2I0AB98_9ASPA|nr:hypothetical protein AXF42_Ash001766 [Apostasia shenzhenica]